MSIKTIDFEKNNTSNLNTSSDNKILIYARFFARIPKYLNKALKIVKKAASNFQDPVNFIFPKLETPLFYLGVGCVAHDIYSDYIKIEKNKDTKYRILFLSDALAYHLLSSFWIPSFTISNIIHYSVLFFAKYIKNKKIMNFTCAIFSTWLIYTVMQPIDTISDFIMDQSFRRVINLNRI